MIMNKHKLKLDDQMKCPTCDHEFGAIGGEELGHAEEFIVPGREDGWEGGASDHCEECGSEFYAYKEDGHVYVEEV